jgi:two-component system, cell cycle sensor histidine kinase PleC
MSEVTAEMIERGRGLDPQTATHKRRVGARVRQARERLTTSDTGHRGTDLQLLRAYAETRVNSAVSAVSLILMMSLLAFYWAPGQRIIIWLVLAFSSLILCYGMAKNLESVEDDKVTVKQWRTKFVGTELVHGVVWAGVAAMLFAAKDPNARTLVLVMLLLSSAFNTMVTATIPAAVYAAIAPSSITAIAYIAYFNRGGGDTFIALLATVVATQVFFYVLA